MQVKEGFLLALLDDAEQGVPAPYDPDVVDVHVGALLLGLAELYPLLGVASIHDDDLGARGEEYQGLGVHRIKTAVDARKLGLSLLRRRLLVHRRQVLRRFDKITTPKHPHLGLPKQKPPHLIRNK